MALRDQITHAFINSGQQVSNTFSVKGAREIGLWAPTVTSGQAFLQASWDTTSGNFVRAGKLDGTGDFAWSVGAGSKYLFTEALRGADHARVAMSAAQTAPRSLMVVMKF